MNHTGTPTTDPSTHIQCLVVKEVLRAVLCLKKKNMLHYAKKKLSKKSKPFINVSCLKIAITSWCDNSLLVSTITKTLFENLWSAPLCMIRKSSMKGTTHSNDTAKICNGMEFKDKFANHQSSS